MCHDKVMLCQGCNVLYHANCSESSFEFEHVKQTWLCISCNATGSERYNPFAYCSQDKYDPVPAEVTRDLETMSNILKNCSVYNRKELNSMFRKNKQQSKERLSILFDNIDGNASNFDHFVADLNQYDDSFDVISIAETNIDADGKDLYHINGYTSEYNSRIVDKKKGSGLGIYIRDTFQFNRLESLCRCSNDLETLFVQITNTEVPQIIGVVYRPPSGNITNALHQLEDLMKSLPADNVSLAGDFNIDLLADNSLSNEYEQVIYSNNFIPLISLATHCKPGCKQTLIDNILVNSTDRVLHSGVLNSSISHHHPIFCVLQCQRAEVESDSATSPKYDYCESHMDSFLGDIENNVPQKSFQLNEEGFNEFVSEINDLIDLHFLVETSNGPTSKRNRLFNPWITNGIMASINTKCYLYTNWKKTCKNSTPLGDWDLYVRYKNHRAILCKTIKLAKKAYYGKKFELAAGNIRKTWQLINELRGKNKTNIKASFIIDGRMVTERREIANGFNIFFSSIATKLNAKVHPSRPMSDPTDHQVKKIDNTFRSYFRNKKRPTNSIFLHPCDSTEVERIIRELDNGKASDISITVLKKCSKYLSGHLSGFFNWFLENGIFPHILKIGSITPVFKKGDARYFDNYRPVSTLPIFGKILEKIIYSRLYDFLISMNLIYDRQFGFRTRHSTCHAINYSVNKILSEIEKKHHVLGIFIDLSKAFDTIDHSKLLEKLQHYGIRGNAHNLLSSYLSNRDQLTNFQKTLSEKCQVLYGVPQGSVLGPLLFLLYINDIVSCSSEGEFVLFADDTNIFVSGKTASEAYIKANTVLRDVNEYMALNQLHINMSKCCYMHFKPDLSRQLQTCARARTYDGICNLYLNEKKVKKVQSTKFLGVVIDEKLSWDDHITYLTAKLNSSIALIKRVKSYIPKSEYLKIYNALFLSHLSYCISCWGGIPEYKLSSIFAIQKRCVRLLFGKTFNRDHTEFYETCARVRTIQEHKVEKSFCLEHTKPIFNEHGLLSLQNFYKYHTFMETFKILKYSTPIVLKNFLNFLPRTNKLLLTVPLVKLDCTKQNFIFKSIEIWNSVSTKIFEKCTASNSGLIIPGSSKNSDMSTPLVL